MEESRENGETEMNVRASVFREIDREEIQEADIPKMEQTIENQDSAQLDKDGQESGLAQLTEVTREQDSEILLISQDEKMQQFQKIMSYIIGHALEANNEKLSQEISSLVNERLSEELEELMRIRDERDEERFRQFDEIIRSYQRDSQGKAEAAAAKIPFFKKKRFRRRRPPQNA